MILYTICDRLYALRIFRSKISVMLIFLFGFGLFFFFYQLLFVLLLDETQKGKPVGLVHENKLANSKPLSVNVTKIFDERGMVRGIRLMDLSKYKPDQDNMFTCIEEKIKIPFAFVNDDYCDCPLDGSDEPGTNACDNGHFYCYTQLRHRTGRGNAQVISSSKVNDGICDCCDGSDEWKKVIFLNALPIELQIKLHRYLSPCSNTCTK